MKDSENQQAKVHAKANGPIIISGKLQFEDDEGNLIETNRLVLCRCVASGKMPYCDGSHNRINFKTI